MAKWGEGDPRWIVEERPDATNVNNWHWSEKNADNWSKQKLKELFDNFEMTDPNVGTVTKLNLDSCSGEARVNNRKGKIIVFFEWNITLSYSTGIAGKSGTEVHGKIELTNFTEDLDDLEITESTPAYSGLGAVRRSSVERGVFRTLLCCRLDEYVQALKSEYNVTKPETVVKSKTVINKSAPPPSLTSPAESNHGQIKSKAKSRKKHITKPSCMSDDVIFYISLLSIVGIGAVVAVKLVNRL